MPFLAAWLDLGRVLPVTTGLSPLRELVAAAAGSRRRKAPPADWCGFWKRPSA